ncbi:hypothetical protein [Anaeromyxobacter paludicola]|uniref:DUF4845 domain-containing protein n=1 Tax=Anaeromyxobacter paludicola TaxID=2918171 RepID=A0ABN6N439_9BACT|nr:hypothetical protein [Anaeromyxobacter paludicola]BDG07741.1 hypothetical protein AMPC_08540 [Anaeromyxobacter paludicola]
MESKRRAPPGFPSQRGEITWVTAVLVLALAVAGYAVWVVFPVYYTHLEVKQVVKDYGNRAIQARDDAALKSGLLRDLAALGKDPGEEDGTERPAVDVAPADLVWERAGSAEAPTLHVAFGYDRHVALPFLERYLDRHFDVDMELDTSRANWGKER